MSTEKYNTKKEPMKITCGHCGRTLGLRAFYSTQNDKYKAFGVIPFCKDCIKESFKESFSKTKSIKASTISTCMRYDIPFYESYLPDNYIEPSEQDFTEETLEESLKIFGEFIKMTNSVGKKVFKKDSFDYEEWVNKVLLQEEKDFMSDDEVLYSSTALDLIEIGEEEIAFFGQGFTRRQYKLLTQSFLSLIKSFECPNSVVASIYKDLSFLDMKIEEAKRQGESDKALTSLMDARRKLFKDAGIDAYRKDSETKVEGIGLMLKKMEQTRPTVKLDEWEDSQIEELATIFAGHIMYGEGEKNEVVDKYLDIVEPYSVDIQRMLQEEGGDENDGS